MTQFLSQSLDHIKDRYSVVIVGSGYGASIAASRMARAGQAVCLLERGREIRPGDYPDTPESVLQELQINGAQDILGKPSGLYNLHVGDDMLAIVGCGLGGTSLINANVALEMDERLFEANAWPSVFQSRPDLLKPFAKRAMTMLDAQPYPDDYPKLNKMQALKRSAKAMGFKASTPPIAVNFVDQINPFGVKQHRCNLCGDCTSGCNVGAKNTLLMNYLPDAKAHGAELFTGAKVSHISHAEDGVGWCVHYAGLDGSRTVMADIVILGAGSLGSTEILLRSQTLALSKKLGEKFSGNGDVLAWGYNSAWRKPEADQDRAPNINGVGVGKNHVAKPDRPGPCITGVIDMRGTLDPLRGLVIEEGVIPGALAAVLPPAMFFAQAQQSTYFRYGAKDGRMRLEDAQAFAHDLLAHPSRVAKWSYKGPVARTQTYLVMSIDDAKGKLRIDDHDRLRITWRHASGQGAYLRDNDWIGMANEAVHGQLLSNPLSTQDLGNRLITAHPLGGCPMGDNINLGVVNHKCQVFTSRPPSLGATVYEGLYVMDGAVIPGAAGVNPLLTISAIAERACQLLADDRGWTIDFSMNPRQPFNAVEEEPPAAQSRVESWVDTLKHRLLEAAAHLARGVAHDLPHDIHRWIDRLLKLLEQEAMEAAVLLLEEFIETYPDVLSPKLSFHESMQGWISTDAVVPRPPADKRLDSDYVNAAAWGQVNGQRMCCELHINVDDLHQLMVNGDYEAQVSGWVNCEALTAGENKTLLVTSGAWAFLQIDPDLPASKTMRYELVLESDTAPNQRYQLTGYKQLQLQSGSSWWQDLTTLFVQVHQGTVEPGHLKAQGILKLKLEDLLPQMTTVSLQPGSSFAEVLWTIPMVAATVKKVYLLRLASAFGMDIFSAYGGMLACLANFPAQEQRARIRRILQAPIPEKYTVPLPHDFSILLTRYKPASNAVTLSRAYPVILAPGFSVKASSFALDTVETNLVEYLCARGYDTWLFDYRSSSDSGSPLKPYTIDDIAKYDWPAAVNHVRQCTGASRVQVIAHCVGSMSLLMAMLNGMDGVQSAICSQLTLHPVTNWLNNLKADSNLVGVLDHIGWLHHALDPVPSDNTDGSMASTFHVQQAEDDDDLGMSNAHDQTLTIAAWEVPKPIGEVCNNPVCHRVSAFFGPSYTHSQLNHETHVALMEMFSPFSLAPMTQMRRIIQAGQVLDADGHDIYMSLDKVKRLAIPISFVAGGCNQLFLPETSARTYRWLCKKNDPDLRLGLYRWYQFDHYAHMDLFIGRDATRDIFPYIFQELKRGAMLNS